MNLLVKIIVVFSAFAGCCLGVLQSGNYRNLISGVSDQYNAPRILFATSTNNLQSFILQQFLHEICREFSANMIVNVVMNINTMKERINFYRRRIDRHLVIVIIRTEKDIIQFQNLTRETPMDSPIWMMIVVADGNDGGICEFCHNPKGNFFRLQRDTEFLVSCCSNTKLEEWWTEDYKTINVQPIAELIDLKLQWVQNKSKFHGRHTNTDLQLRVLTLKNSVTFGFANGTCSGFMGEILTALMKSMNFTIGPPILVDTRGIWNETESKWTDAMGFLQRGEADITAIFMTMTRRRLEDVDSTVPLIISKFGLFMRKPIIAGEVRWLAYFEIFEMRVWLAIVAILFTTCALSILIEYNPRRNRFFSVVFEECLHVFGIFCQQGLSKFPTLSSLKIIYYSILLTTSIILAAYSACLISILSAPPIKLPFNTFEEFSNQNDYKLIVRKGSSAYEIFSQSKNPMEKRIFKLMQPPESLPESSTAIILRMCEEKEVFFGSILDLPAPKESLCEIVQIEESYLVKVSSILLRPGSPHNNIINSQIIKFHNNGFLQYLFKKYYTLESNSSGEKIWNEVDFLTIVPILVIVGGGILLSLFLLFFELMYQKHSL